MNLNCPISKQTGWVRWSRSHLPTFCASLTLSYSALIWWVRLCCSSKNPNFLLLTVREFIYCFMQSQLHVWAPLQSNCLRAVIHYSRLTQAPYIICTIWNTWSHWWRAGKEATRESYKGFSVTQLSCDIYHCHSVCIDHSRTWPMTNNSPGYQGRRQEKGMRCEHFCVLRREVLVMSTHSPLSKTEMFYFSSCFISSSDKRSEEKTLLSPFYLWGNMLRRLSNTYVMSQGCLMSGTGLSSNSHALCFLLI